MRPSMSAAPLELLFPFLLPFSKISATSCSAPAVVLLCCSDGRVVSTQEGRNRELILSLGQVVLLNLALLAIIKSLIIIRAYLTLVLISLFKTHS